MAQGLGQSLSFIGDPTPRAVLTDIDSIDWKRHFHHVLKPHSLRSALDKLILPDYIPNRRYLAIDGDCLAFKPLKTILDQCQGSPLVVQGNLRTTGPWHGWDIAEACKRHAVSALPKFNGGLLYYEDGQEFQELMSRAKHWQENYSDSGFASFRGNASEEICLSLAMAETGIGIAIDPVERWMSSAPGAIGPIHMDIRQGLCRFVSRGDQVRREEPILFHASSLVSFRQYWRQLDVLQALDDYADRHPPGYRSRGWKLRRSFDRRWLQWIRRKL